MENKNVFVAIALSMAVLLFWGAFVEKPKPVSQNLSQQNLQKNSKNENTVISPTINETLEIKEVSREETVNKVDRIKIENNSIVGSISLQGGIIDDISFKNHKEDLKEKKKCYFSKS